MTETTTNRGDQEGKVITLRNPATAPKVSEGKLLRVHFFGMLLVGLTSIAVMACDDTARALNEESQEEARKAREAAERAQRDAEQAARDAKQAVTDAAEQAKQDIRRAAEETKERIDEADKNLAEKIREE